MTCHDHPWPKSFHQERIEELQERRAEASNFKMTSWGATSSIRLTKFKQQHRMFTSHLCFPSIYSFFLYIYIILNYTYHLLLSLHNRPIGFHYLSVSALIGTPCWGVPTPSTAARSSQIGRGKKFWGIGLSRWANLSHSRVWSCQ